MASILKLCQRCVYIDDGRVQVSTDQVKDAIEEYSGKSISGKQNYSWQGKKEKSNDWFTASRVYLRCSRENIKSHFKYDDKITVNILGTIHKLHPALQIGYALYSAKTNELLYWCSFTDLPNDLWPKIKLGKIKLTTDIPVKLLNEGPYRLEMIAGLNKIEWFYQPEGNSPKIYFTIADGLPQNSLWNSYKPGYIAPLSNWKAERLT